MSPAWAIAFSILMTIVITFVFLAVIMGEDPVKRETKPFHEKNQENEL